MVYAYIQYKRKDNYQAYLPVWACKHNFPKCPPGSGVFFHPCEQLRGLPRDIGLSPPAIVIAPC